LMPLTLTETLQPEVVVVVVLSSDVPDILRCFPTGTI